MRSWTWLEIKTKVQNDLDLVSEDFITATELLGYANEAIDDAEAEIHTLYEDYFLTKGTVSLVTSTSAYSLPSDIYANKLRRIIYNDGSSKYNVERIKRIEDTSVIQATDFYKYIILNDATLGIQVNLYPPSRETSSTVMTWWYIRNAARLSLDADVCDIPEFVNYVIQHMKVRCYEKEGHPNLAGAMDQKERLKMLMVETLENMVDDEDTGIQMDLSFYDDFDSSWKIS